MTVEWLFATAYLITCSSMTPEASAVGRHALVRQDDASHCCVRLFFRKHYTCIKLTGLHTFDRIMSNIGKRPRAVSVFFFLFFFFD